MVKLVVGLILVSTTVFGWKVIKTQDMFLYVENKVQCKTGYTLSIVERNGVYSGSKLNGKKYHSLESAATAGCKLITKKPVKHHKKSFTQKTYFMIVNRKINRCLTVQGKNVVSSAIYRAEEQLWVDAGHGYIRNKKTNLCLDVKGHRSKKNGTNIGVWTCDYLSGKSKKTDQTWTFTRYGQIQNKSTYKCIDVAGNLSPKNGANVQQWSCEKSNQANTDQLWKKVYPPKI